jgi:hypothetical protein
VRYRTCRVAARFLKGRVVRAVWVQVEQPDRGGLCRNFRVWVGRLILFRPWLL